MALTAGDAIRYSIDSGPARRAGCSLATWSSRSSSSGISGAAQGLPVRLSRPARRRHADATKDVLTDYAAPAEMTATGELAGGKPHIHVVMAIEGDRAVSGHLHRARIGTHFTRAYLLPAP